MGPEWCYQWKDPEFVDRYYKSLERGGQEEGLINSVVENLKENFWAIEVKPKKEKPFQKKADAKDAIYFSDL